MVLLVCFGFMGVGGRLSCSVYGGGGSRVGDVLRVSGAVRWDAERYLGLCGNSWEHLGCILDASSSL